MKTRPFIGGAALGAIISLVAAQALSTPQDTSPDMPQVDCEAMNAAFQAGPQHERLKQFVGDWDITLSVYFAGPDGPAMTSKGSSTIKSVLGGKFTLEEMQWSMKMPDEQGNMTDMRFSGIGLNGYDNFRKTYVTAWADSMNTHIVNFSGTSVPGSDAVTFYGQMDEPGLGIIGRTIKSTVTRHDKDHFTMEMYDLAVSDDYKVMELKYTRRK